MFGIADLIVVAGMKDALDFLSKNPKHIEFILGAFNSDKISHIVGKKHIDDCVRYIVNNRIEVAPYYQMDIKKRPSLSVVASYTESQQFVGDQGRTEYSMSLPARIYETFTVKRIEDQTLYVSPELALEDKLWLGLHITKGNSIYKLRGILAREGQDTQLVLDRTIKSSDNTIEPWHAASARNDKIYSINSSQDDVQVQMNLQTIGDASTHRLLATVIRYCLKKQRLWLDSYGLQVSTFSQTPPILTEEGESEFQTVFTIQSKFTDSWIDYEKDLPDPTANIKIELEAESSVLSEERDNVDLP
jgi:predicted DNA-binding helix-hairpin-helix protein